MKTILTLAAAALLVTPLFADATPDGGAIFKSKCALCHGPDGNGQTPVGKSMKVRPLGSQEVQKLTDAELATIISDGKEKMPAFKGKLSPEEVKQVVAYIRTFSK